MIGTTLVNLVLKQWVLCNAYNVTPSNSINATNIQQICSFTLAPSYQVTVSLCGVSGVCDGCVGDTTFRILDSSGNSVMEADDGCSPSSLCSCGQFASSSSSKSENYYLSMGCYGATTGCSGQPALYMDHKKPFVNHNKGGIQPLERRPTLSPISAFHKRKMAMPSKPVSPPSTPSAPPSVVPTVQPSGSPSSSPSAPPSVVPSVQNPSASPSSSPSAPPSVVPS
eukprot:scaffold1568_cov264-Ochromonas_danica.AAC.1